MEKPSFNTDNTGYILMRTIGLLTRIVILRRFRSDTPSPSGILCVYFYAKYEHGTGIAGVSRFLLLNLTSVLIRLCPCYIKDGLRLEELPTFLVSAKQKVQTAPEPVPEKLVKKKLPQA